MKRKNFVKIKRLELYKFHFLEVFWISGIITFLSILISEAHFFYMIALAPLFMFFIYLNKKDNYTGYNLYQLFYWRHNTYKLILSSISVSFCLSYFLINFLEYNPLYNGEINNYNINKDFAVYFSFLLSIIFSGINYFNLNTRLDELIIEEIFKNKIISKIIIDKIDSPVSLINCFLERSETANLWYSSLECEEDLINDIYYGGTLY